MAERGVCPYLSSCVSMERERNAQGSLVVVLSGEKPRGLCAKYQERNHDAEHRSMNFCGTYL